MKILSVIGARPQFVKAAVVSSSLSEKVKSDEFLVHTGPHFDENMPQVFFEEMGIPKPSAHRPPVDGSSVSYYLLIVAYHPCSITVKL